MNPIKNLFSFKTVCVDNKTFLVFSVSRREGINYSHLQLAEDPAFREFLLPFECTKISRSNMVRFDVSGLTALSEYLRIDMTQEQYFEIISSIGKAVLFCQQNNLSCDNLVLNPKYMYYHNTLGRVLVAYIPLKNPHYVRNSIPKCLLSIHNSAEHVAIGPAMGIYEKNLYRYAEEAKKKDDVAMRELNELFFRSNEPEKLRNAVENCAGDPDAFDNAGIFALNNDPVRFTPGRVSPSQTSISGVRAGMDEVYLTDSKGVRYDIRDLPFSIGRSSDRDLVIEQATVSGDHAVITREDGKYFIRDNSTNGTYLNSEENRISFSELNDGDRLFFDQYCYTFSVTRNISDDGAARTVIVSNRNAAADSSAPENSAEADAGSSGRARAYLKRSSDESLIKIMDYPFSSPQIDGAVIYALELSGTTSLFIKNVSCSSLMFENVQMKDESSEELFSGCSLQINGENYMFIVEN